MPARKSTKPSKHFSRKHAQEVLGRERKTIRGIKCPDLPGDLSEVEFTVKEPTAADVVRAVNLGHEYGETGQAVAVFAACVVDENGKQCFSIESAMEFVKEYQDLIEPLTDAINKLDLGQQGEEDPHPFD